MYKVDRVNAEWQRDVTVPELKDTGHNPHKVEWRRERNRARACPSQLEHLERIRAMIGRK